MKKSSPKREYKDYLTDIFNSLEQIEKFVLGLDFNGFSRDEKTKYAVIRAFEIVGEAVKNVPQKVKNSHKEILWKDWADLRNELIHEYFGVNTKVVWRAIKKDVPDLKKKMEVLLKELKINKLI